MNEEEGRSLICMRNGGNKDATTKGPIMEEVSTGQAGDMEEH